MSAVCLEVAALALEAVVAVLSAKGSLYKSAEGRRGAGMVAFLIEFEGQLQCLALRVAPLGRLVPLWGGYL